jgi:uncharacterized tellurite resistance protein B-like protein
MSKTKLVAIIETDDNTVIDGAMFKRTISVLGNVESCKVESNFDETNLEESTAKPDEKKPTSSLSEMSQFINDANKIYYGSLSIDERKIVSISIIHVSNLEKIEKDPEFKKKIITILVDKFEADSNYVENLFNENKDQSSLDNLKSKFLEGDLNQIFTYIWEKILSKGEEDDFEVELIESIGEKFGLEKTCINDTKKMGNERAKITKAINSIESGKVAYNKLKAFEKTVLIGLMLTECSTIDGKISPDDLNQLKNIFNEQFNISSNVISVILEKKLEYSITKKVEQVEVYREKYELVEFLWEKILSTENDIKDGEMGLIRKWVRRLDISDVESEGARKDAEANLNPKE